MDTVNLFENYESLPSLEGASPAALAKAIAEVLDAKKGGGISVLHIGKKTVLADYFVICTGGSNTQIKSLADEVEYRIGTRGVSPAHVEGRDNGTWSVLDYSSVIVHIFSRDAREFYKLEKLWADAEEVDPSGLGDTEKNEDEAI